MFKPPSPAEVEFDARLEDPSTASAAASELRQRGFKVEETPDGLQLQLPFFSTLHWNTNSGDISSQGGNTNDPVRKQVSNKVFWIFAAMVVLNAMLDISKGKFPGFSAVMAVFLLGYLWWIWMRVKTADRATAAIKEVCDIVRPMPVDGN